MKITLYIFSLLLCYSVQAQEFVEKVYLNDSTTVYEGLIIEQAPAKHIKILRRKERDTIEVLLRNIWKLTKEYPKPDTGKKVVVPIIKARQANANRSVYLEALGAAGLYSFNFDSRLVKGKRDGWGMRAGVGFFPIKTINYYGDTLGYRVFSLPVMINYLYGKNLSYLELGLGVTYFISSANGDLQAPKSEYTISRLGTRIPHVLGTFMIGYRYMPTAKGVTYGISFNPLIGNNFRFPSLGIKIGYTFK